VAFATGILIDAFLIRMTLIPALMSVMDRHAWWIPRWLDRIVPNVDIEGTSLEREPKRVGAAEPVAGD
jgi:RND superfamily putative drug exporter